VAGVVRSGAWGGAHKEMLAGVDEVVKLYFVNGLDCWGCGGWCSNAGEAPSQCHGPACCVGLRQGPSTARADAFGWKRTRRKGVGSLRSG
jgi:hypothetical protein